MPAPPPNQAVTFTNAPPPSNVCLQTYCCAVCFVVFAIVILFIGVINIGVGAGTRNTLSSDFYETFPETRRRTNRQLYIGVAMLVVGFSLFTIGLVWCRCIKNRQAATPVVTYGGGTSAMLTTNYATSSGSYSTVVQPPPLQPANSGYPTYTYHAVGMQDNRHPAAHPANAAHLPPPSYDQAASMPGHMETKQYGQM